MLSLYLVAGNFEAIFCSPNCKKKSWLETILTRIAPVKPSRSGLQSLWKETINILNCILFPTFIYTKYVLVLSSSNLCSPLLLLGAGQLDNREQKLVSISKRQAPKEFNKFSVPLLDLWTMWIIFPQFLVKHTISVQPFSVKIQ